MFWAIVNRMISSATAMICAMQMWYWHSKLPDPIPSHFDAAGHVNGEMSLFGFYALMIILQVVMLVLFPVLGAFLKVIPNSFINVPNKDYWLAPERRDSTLLFNSTYLVAIGWQTSWLLILIFHLTCMVAVEKRAAIMPEFNVVLAGYLAVVFGGVIYLYYRFRRPKLEVN
jgi:hypothetical protein